MKLLDTNIVVYALGRPHPYKAPCWRLFQDIAAGSTAYTIDVELLQEVLYVYTMRAERSTALQVFDRLTQIFPNPIPIGRQEMHSARDLLERYSTLSPRDAIHAAVVLIQEMEGLVTTDRSLGRVEGLACFDPLVLYPK